ncbi:MAG: hypothetical protein EAZ97_00970 [Bacteroidetes bacterium]|nr:MAG: hypothetical protein EAZ97_00970 [Bacteroidota bacterium]
MTKVLLFFLCLLYFAKPIFAQNLQAKIDSLEKILPNLTSKQKISNCIELCWTVRHLDPEKAINYGWQAVILARKTNEKELESDALNRLGVCYRNKLEGVKAISILDTALKVAKQANSLKQMAYAYNNIGSVYGYLVVSNPMWLENSHKAVSIFTKIKNYSGVADALRYVAMAHNNSQNYDSAIFYSKKATEISREHQLWNDYIRSLAYLSNIYRDNKQNKLLQNYIEKALYISQKHKFSNIPFLHLYLHNLFNQQKYDSVTYYLKKVENNHETTERDALWFHNYSADVALAKKDSAKASKHLIRIRTILDSLHKNDKQKLLLDHGLLQKQKEVELQQFEILQKEQNEYFYVFGLITLIVIIILFGYYFWKSKKFSQILSIKNQEVKQTMWALQLQRNELQDKNEDIIASINYALRIQNAIMPTEQEIQRYFPESFVLFMPKDIVSGDFYWFADKIDKKIIVVADCTGHGVSGAFMTMIGNNILNQIVHDYEIHAPDEILSQMPIFLEKTLSHADGKVKDGMDISIITIHKSVQNSENINTKIEYSGAMNPLYYVQNQEFIEIKADKMPIGGNHKNEDFDYQKHEISLQSLEDRSQEMGNSNFSNLPSQHSSLTTFYLCTDGYQDQFGGKDGKKFMVKKLRNLLFEISEKPMPAQKEILSQTLKNWIAEGNEKQIDDITILGIRI